MKYVACVEQGNPAEGSFGKVACLERPAPKIMHPDEVLIRIAFSSVCGSDAHVLDGNFPIPERLPRALGHEMSGIIEDMGEEAASKSGLKAGDRVTGNFVRYCGSCYYCRTGHENLCVVMDKPYPQTQAEYVVWHYSQCYRIPDEVSLLEACLTEPAAIAWHLVEQAPIKLGGRIAVAGGGGIGLLVLQMALMYGASSATVIEPFAEKRELAMQLGARNVIDPFRENVAEIADDITEGHGYDAVFDTTTSLTSAAVSIDIAGKGGHIVFCSKFPKDARLPLNLYKDLYLGEKNIHGSQMSPYSYQYVVQLLPRLHLNEMIQKVYTLEECEQAYADQISGKYIKIAFDCQKHVGKNSSNE